MADLTTVSGGAKHGVSSLSPAEHKAAITALSKLTSGGASHGVSSALSTSLRSATLKGGSVHSDGVRQSTSFAGGVHTGATPAFKAIGSDTVKAGSAFSSKGPQAAGSTHGLGGAGADTIKVAGVTAASVKNENAHDAKAGHTITLSDKTTITLTGVSTHDVVKPH